MFAYAIDLGHITVASGAASATSAAAPANTTHARLVGTAAAHIVIGAGPALATDALVGPNFETYIRISATQTISAIQDAAAGVVSIVWLQLNPKTQGGNYVPGVNP